VNEDEFYKRLAQTMGERDQAMRDYLEACQARDEARRALSEVAGAVGGVLSGDDLVSEVQQLVKDRAFLKNHYSMEAAAMLRAELASARAEVERLRDALRKLLLSRDAAWTGGHDWQESVDGAITALGVEVGE